MRWSALLLLLTSAHASAQFYDFLAHPAHVPADGRAFTAQITATLTAKTPWGETKSVETGTIWRSGDGRERFDNAYGGSTVRDRRGPLVLARIDHELRLVEIEETVASAAGGAEPWSALAFPSRVGGEKTVEGLAVTVRTGSDHGVSYEVWASDTLGVLLYVRYKTDKTVFEQRLSSLRFEEPDPKLLQIPDGYRTHITCWTRTGAVEAPRQTYTEGRSACAGGDE